MEPVILLGGDEDAVQKPMEGLTRWAEAQLEVALGMFKALPTETTARAVLQKAERVILFGGQWTHAVDQVLAWSERTPERGHE